MARYEQAGAKGGSSRAFPWGLMFALCVPGALAFGVLAGRILQPMSLKDWQTLAEKREEDLTAARIDTATAKRELAECRNRLDAAATALGAEKDETVRLMAVLAAEKERYYGLKKKVAELTSQVEKERTQRIVAAPVRKAPEGRALVPKPPRAVTRSVSNLSFFVIRKNMLNMTEAQWKEYARGIKGQTIQWAGWVDDVDERFFGGYRMLVDMDPPEEFSIQDVYFDVAKDLALRLRKDQRITFRGTISLAYDLFGACQISLNDAQIVGY